MYESDAFRRNDFAQNKLVAHVIWRKKTFIVIFANFRWAEKKPGDIIG
jgi:hypothetical protein